MAQNVVLKIAGKEYPLEASTPEMEQMMRMAASDVNAMLEKFDSRFPDTELPDKFAFVAEQEAVGKLYAKKKYDTLKSELEALNQELSSYLEGR